MADESRAPINDILDAIATLWTAHRILDGMAETLPPSPPQDEAGLPMRIVCCRGEALRGRRPGRLGRPTGSAGVEPGVTTQGGTSLCCSHAPCDPLRSTSVGSSGGTWPRITEQE